MAAYWILLFLLTLYESYSDEPSHPAAILKAHNLYRQQLGAPPLNWSKPLAARAQQWASYLIQQGRFAPRRDGIYGENLFEVTGGSASPENVVAAWMSEESNYDVKSNTCRARCGHYTQVIWNDSRLVGCGAARNRTHEIWVCNYDPPGNIRVRTSSSWRPVRRKRVFGPAMKRMLSSSEELVRLCSGRIGTADRVSGLKLAQYGSALPRGLCVREGSS